MIDQEDQELEVEQEADENIQELDGYDVDLGDVEGEQPEQELEVEGEEQPSEDDPRFAELRAELEQAKRAIADARDTATREQFTERVSDKPPIARDKIQTYEQLLEYMEWKDAKNEEKYRILSAREGAASASKQRARGQLNRENMGQGYDFDTIVSDYVGPALKANPELSKLFQGMGDPAMAEYGVGLLIKAIETHKGDAVKAFQSLKGALEGKRASTEDLMDKIRKGAKGQAIKARASKKAPSEAGRPRLDARLLDENGYLNVDLDEFQKKYASKDNY